MVAEAVRVDVILAAIRDGAGIVAAADHFGEAQHVHGVGQGADAGAAGQQGLGGEELVEDLFDKLDNRKFGDVATDWNGS